MGLFGKILGSVIEEAVKKVQESQGNKPTYSEPVRTSYQNSCNVSTSDGEKRDKNYFREILNSEFSRYTVKENVPVSEIGGEGRNYDFGLYENGILKGFVVLVEHNRTNNKAYKDSKQYAQNAKIPFINFHLHMPNKRDFVIYRVNNQLRITN
jgi:hypothetical protein